MVQLELLRLGVNVMNGRVESELRPESISSSFLHDPTLWKQFYSEKTLFHTKANAEFVAPDLKPLPLKL